MTDWTPDDRDVALVWHQEQKSKCPRCGTWEWQHDEEDWEADHFTCEGCRMLDAHSRDVDNSPGSKDGIKMGLFRGD